MEKHEGLRAGLLDWARTKKRVTTRMIAEDWGISFGDAGIEYEYLKAIGAVGRMGFVDEDNIDIINSLLHSEISADDSSPDFPGDPRTDEA